MKNRLFVLFSVFFLLGNYSFATHISGGDITYECLGNNQYLITLNLYRDCGGSLFSNPQPLNISGNCGTQTVNANLINPGGTEVSQICDEQISQSVCNGGNLPGVQKFIFQTMVTLAPCADWKISWKDCCRNNNIINISGFNEGTYIEATLNSINNPCNNSPVFSAQPIPYACANQPVTFNWGTTESDGDSVTYTLISARKDADTNLVYSNPYSATNPIDGITMDSFTGELSFTPATNGNFVLVMQIDEYDASGNLLGTIMRDIQFVVIACSNTPPPSTQGQLDTNNFTGTATIAGNYSIEMCDGGNFSFTISYSDPDANDTLTITSNVTEILPGSDFETSGTNPVAVTVSWAAPGSSVFFNSFTIFVNDGACPVPSIQSTNFQVSVVPATVASPDTTIICGAQSASLSVSGGNNFIWSVISGDPLVAGTNFSCDNCANPVANPDSTTFYEVSSDLSSSVCATKDTVQVKVVPEFSFQKILNDSAICLNEPLQLEINPDATSPSYSYLWTSEGNFSDNSISNPTVVFDSSGMKTIYVEITSEEGCVKKDSMALTVSPGQIPDIQLFADTAICFGDSTQLNAVSATSDSTYKYVWSPSAELSDDSVKNPWAKPANDILFSVIAYDTIANCADTASVFISVAQNFNYTKSQSDTAICLNDTVQFIVTPDTGSLYAFEWNPPTFLNNPNAPNPVAVIGTAGNYTYYFSVSNGCDETDSFKITVSEGAIPVLTISGNDSICNGDSTQLSATSASGISPTYSFDWNNGAFPGQSNITVAPVSNTTYTLIVSDVIGNCADTAAFTVNVLQIPVVQILTFDDTICFKDDPLSFSATPQGGATIWSGIGISPSGIFSPLQAGNGTHQIFCNITVPAPPAFGCMGKDSALITVEPNPATPLILADNPYCEFSVIDSLTATNSGGTIVWFSDSQLTDTIFVGNPYKNIAVGSNNISVYVTETSANACVSKPANWFEIIVVPNPQASFNASPDEGFEPLAVSFSNTSQPAINANSYSWNFGGAGNSSAQSPSFIFEKAGTYDVILSVADSNNCRDTFLSTVVVFEESKIEIPNVFTPNGDGKNDMFKISATALTEYRIAIYNRWGRKVFEKNDLTESWNGNSLQGHKLAPGTYFYVITATDRLGNPIDKKEIKGMVTLLRD